MAWSGVITNAGAAMLNQLAAGEHVLHIDNAKVGSGTTAAENMRSATALNTQKDSASILSSRVQSGRVQIKVQVGPNVSAGYTAHEIGVWAHVDSGASALFALHQDTGDGVAIPSTAENPDFAFALYIVFAAANTANIAVTVDTSATVSESTLAEALEDYATKAELAAAEEALSEVASIESDGLMSKEMYYTFVAHIGGTPWVQKTSGYNTTNVASGSYSYTQRNRGVSCEFTLTTKIDITPGQQVELFTLPSTFLLGDEPWVFIALAYKTTPSANFVSPVICVFGVDGKVSVNTSSFAVTIPSGTIIRGSFTAMQSWDD